MSENAMTELTDDQLSFEVRAAFGAGEAPQWKQYDGFAIA